MARFEKISTADIGVDFVIAASQYFVGKCLFSDAKPRVSKPVFHGLLALFASLCVVCAAGMILNLIGPHPEWNRFLTPLPIAVVSSIELMWGFISAISVALYMAFRAWFRSLPPTYSPMRRRLLQAGATAIVAAPAAALSFGALIERRNFQVVEVDLPIPDLHRDLEGFTIAQLSDFHVSPYLSVRDAGRAVDMANELKPRLTLVTGDLISSRGDPLDATIAELARLRADTGVLGCLGNHEIYAQCEDYAEQQARRVGIEFLRLSARRIHWGNGQLNFAGVDYQPFRNRAAYLKGADKLIVTGMPNILLSHNPDVFPVAARQGYQAVLSGHTHGGQVTVEILRQTLNVVRFLTPYVAGLYRQGGSACYVTAGIGTIGMPVRLGATPEITLLKLRRA